jgi:hypothetical protein
MSYQFKLVPINDLHQGDIVLAQFSVSNTNDIDADFIGMYYNRNVTTSVHGLSIVLSKEPCMYNFCDSVLYNRLISDPEGTIYVSGERFRITDSIHTWHPTQPYAIVFSQRHHTRRVRRLLKGSDHR